MKLPSSVMAKCMANPVISSSLKWFPVLVPDGARHVAIVIINIHRFFTDEREKGVSLCCLLCMTYLIVVGDL